jgi:hypothetical protein
LGTGQKALNILSFNHPRGYMFQKTNEKMARGFMLLKTNEELGEAELATRSASQIESTSILASGNADTRWRARAVWVQ